MAPKPWKVEAAAREALQATGTAEPSAALNPDVYRSQPDTTYRGRSSNIANKPRRSRDGSK